jgi:hypothetical protein
MPSVPVHRTGNLPVAGTPWAFAGRVTLTAMRTPSRMATYCEVVTERSNWILGL